jgi:hypothetical protein
LLKYNYIVVPLPNEFCECISSCKGCAIIPHSNHEVNGEVGTFIHFIPKFQGAYIKYHGTFKVLQPTYENEMDA